MLKPSVGYIASTNVQQTSSVIRAHTGIEVTHYDQEIRGLDRGEGRLYRGLGSGVRGVSRSRDNCRIGQLRRISRIRSDTDRKIFPAASQARGLRRMATP